MLVNKRFPVRNAICKGDLPIRGGAFGGKDKRLVVVSSDEDNADPSWPTLAVLPRTTQSGRVGRDAPRLPGIDSPASEMCWDRNPRDGVVDCLQLLTLYKVPDYKGICGLLSPERAREVATALAYHLSDDVALPSDWTFARAADVPGRQSYSYGDLVWIWPTSQSKSLFIVVSNTVINRKRRNPRWRDGSLTPLITVGVLLRRRRGPNRDGIDNHIADRSTSGYLAGGARSARSSSRA